MQIAVFGISGRTGRALLEATRGRGIDVVALVRPAVDVPVASNLRVRWGDLSDLGAVQEVVAEARGGSPVGSQQSRAADQRDRLRRRSPASPCSLIPS